VWVNWFRLAFAGLLGFLAAGLLLRHTLFGPAALGQFDQSSLNTGGTLATSLALYNFVRWWLVFRKSQRRVGPRNPLNRRTNTPTVYEHQPDLDFTNRRPANPPDPG
jgi:hypothetical protein